MNEEILSLTKSIYLGGKDAGNKEMEQFYAKNMDKAAFLVNDRESLIISAIRIAHRIGREDIKRLFPDIREAMLDNLELRGLIKTDAEGYCTTCCIQATALYPLLGEEYTGPGRKRRAGELAKVILSMIGAESMGQRELKSIFSRKNGKASLLFPYLDAEEIEMAFLHSLSSLISLSVIEEGERRLKLNFPLLRSFLDLDELNMYSYLLWPGLDPRDRKNSIRFLSLLFQSGRIREEDLGMFFQRLGILSSFQVDDPGPFFSLLLLGRDGEGNVYVRMPEDQEEREISISSDYSISIIGKIPAVIFLTASAVQIDRIKIFRMDRLSLKTAFNLGMDAESIIGELKKYAKGFSSETLYERIRSWYREFSRIRICRAMVLVTDARSANILSSIPAFMEYVVKDSGNGFFLMDENGEENWRRILEKGGFDLLAEPSGPRFCETERKAENFTAYTITPVFQQKSRMVTYRPECRNEEITEKEEKDNSLRVLKNMLVKSGILLKSEIISRRLPFQERDAFDYQEKLRLIQYAYRNRDFCLQVENHRGQSAVGRVEMVEDYADGDHMVLGRKILNISRLYKVRLIPAAYLTYPSQPSTGNGSRRTPQTEASPAQAASQNRNGGGNQPSGLL